MNAGLNRRPYKHINSNVQTSHQCVFCVFQFESEFLTLILCCHFLVNGFFFLLWTYRLILFEVGTFVFSFRFYGLKKKKMFTPLTIDQKTSKIC